MSVSKLKKEVMRIVEVEVDHSIPAWHNRAKGYRVEFRRYVPTTSGQPPHKRWNLFDSTRKFKGTWEEGYGAYFVYEAEAVFFARQRSEKHPKFEYRITTQGRPQGRVVGWFRDGMKSIQPWDWADEPIGNQRKQALGQLSGAGEEPPDIHPLWPTTSTRKGAFAMAKVDLSVEDYGTLTFAKDDLVTRLKERLAANEAERQAKKDKAAARNKEAHDRIVAALDNPQFLVWLAGQIKKYNSDFDAASDAFATRIAETWPDTDGDDLPEASDPDRALRTMIDVYELASDTEVKIAVTDEAYKYLGKPKETATPAPPAE